MQDSIVLVCFYIFVTFAVAEDSKLSNETEDTQFNTTTFSQFFKMIPKEKDPLETDLKTMKIEKQEFSSKQLLYSIDNPSNEAEDKANRTKINTMQPSRPRISAATRTSRSAARMLAYKAWIPKYMSGVPAYKAAPRDHKQDESKDQAPNMSAQARNEQGTEKLRRKKKGLYSRKDTFQRRKEGLKIKVSNATRTRTGIRIGVGKSPKTTHRGRYDRYPDRNSGHKLDKLIIGVIWPHTIFLDKKFLKVLRNAISEVGKNSELYRFLKQYSLIDYIKVPFPVYPSPTQILDAFIHHFIPGNVSAIVYLSTFEGYGRSTAAAQYFLQLSGYLGIPVISWNADNSGLEKGALQLQLAPSLEHQVNAMLSILVRYNWHQFAVVTSNIAGYANFILVVREKTKKLYPTFKFSIISTVTVGENNDLSQLASSEARIMLLYSTKEEASGILSAASQAGLTGTNYVWIVTQSVVDDRMPGSSFPVGMLGVHFATENKGLLSHIRNAIKVFAEGVESFTRKHNASLVAVHGDTDVKWSLGDTFYKHLAGVSIARSSVERVLEFKSDGTLRYTQLKILNLRPNLQENLKWEQIGTWRSGQDEGLDIKDIVWPGYSHVPPHGVPEKFHMRIAFLEEEPFLNIGPPDPISGKCTVDKGVRCWTGGNNDTNRNVSSSHWQCCSGFCIDLLRKFQEDLPFTFDLFRSPDSRWGTFQGGRWNGLVGEIIEGRADMILSAFQVSSDREHILDFSIPFIDTAIALVVAKRTGIISPTAFLEPFDTASWMLVSFVAVQVAAVTIFMFEWLSPVGYDMKISPPRDHKFSLLRSYWLVWAIFFQAAVNVDCPRGYTARFMANVWSMFAVVFLAIYTANLAAFMITREEYYDLNGIEDPRLLNPSSIEPPFRFGTVLHTNTELILKRSHPQYAYMKAYSKLNVHEGIQSIKQGHLDAFIYDATVLDYLVGQDNECRLLSVGSWYGRTGYALGFAKGSKKLKEFNDKLLNYRADGELDRLTRFWLSGVCRPEKQKRTSSKPLSMSQFLSAFFLLFSGIFLAFMLLLIEHSYFKYVRKHLAKTERGGCCALLSLSMGKSLSFSGAVFEAQDALKYHKCRDPLCETHLWKVKHELDMAKIRLANLESELEKRGIRPRYSLETKSPQKLIQKTDMTRNHVLCTHTSRGYNRNEAITEIEEKETVL